MSAFTTAHRLVIAVAVLASFVTFLDGTVVTVALPAISAELGGGIATQQWVGDASLITLSALILLVPSSLALITATMRGDLQSRAIGVWTAFTTGAELVGPLLGGCSSTCCRGGSCS